MPDMTPFIGYHFFHRAGRIGRAQAYAKIHRAMEDFSDQKAPILLSMMLDMRADNSDALEFRVRRICDTFGPVEHTTASPTWKEYRAYDWRLGPESASAALALLDEFDQQDASLADRTFFRASWKFKFVEPETRCVLPGQEGLPILDFRLGPGSSLNFAAHKGAAVNAWFLFPFEEPTADFQNYVARFQEQLIFKFSPKHWKHWRFVRGEWKARNFVPNW
jgi:hypothetical protein